MRRWTLDEIQTKIKQDLDIEAEDFVVPTELLAIINEGIDECEANIHRLGREDDYFLTKAYIPVVQGTQQYSLPDDIYANKIRGMVYSEGSTIYEVNRVRGMHKFELMERILQYSSSTDYYRYIILNENTANGYKIEFYPAPRQTGSQLFKMWYIRNANRLSDPTDVCDIPEFVYYIIDFAKFEVLKKEGNPMAEAALIKLTKSKELMLETLGDMVPDEDNLIIKDLEHYDDMA